MSSHVDFERNKDVGMGKYECVIAGTVYKHEMKGDVKSCRLRNKDVGMGL